MQAATQQQYHANQICLIFLSLLKKASTCSFSIGGCSMALLPPGGRTAESGGGKHSLLLSTTQERHERGHILITNRFLP